MTGEVEHLIKIGTDLQRYATAAGIHNVMTDNSRQSFRSPNIVSRISS